MVRAGTVITIEAPAKINLTLEVLGKRPDGYHELRSIVMPVSLADTLSLTTTYAQTAMTLTVAPGVDLSKIGSVDRNLAVRAARLMQERYRVNAGARIHIHKRIPIGGGVGGWKPGSRDITWHRTVTAVSGKLLTLDAPLTTTLEEPGTYISPISPIPQP